MELVQEAQTKQAVLLRKSCEEYEDLASGKGIPIKKPIFELTFQLEDEELITFEVSEYEYHVVQEQEKGTLRFIKHEHCNELVSFADKIKEFHMEES